MSHMFQKGEYFTIVLPTGLASAPDLFKGNAMCYCVYVTMHVNDPQIFVVKAGHYHDYVPVAAHCLFL